MRNPLMGIAALHAILRFEVGQALVIMLIAPRLDRNQVAPAGDLRAMPAGG